ncbi:hypothetical protein FA15DRAFT_700723 [Coprinopsis marcescibilis]|uniref:RRM domain-containing protein n=1 Tax=Coprinopsis marcescibilis TaxID=230819 RepID=A0A5C3L742_COPMA|nr:hypothetical protein FA15DRAFT_700723 [Coprinopsis marcescibilis]
MAYQPTKRLYLRGLAKDITPDSLSEALSDTNAYTYLFSCFHSISPPTAKLAKSNSFTITRLSNLKQRRMPFAFLTHIEALLCLDKGGGMTPTPSDVLIQTSSNRGGLSRHPVVVTGLPEDIRWQELKDFGRSTGCLVAFCDLDTSDSSRGFIEYFTKNDAEYAIRTLDGKDLGGETVRVISYSSVSNERRRSTPYPFSRTRSNTSIECEQSRSARHQHQASYEGSMHATPRDCYSSFGSTISMACGDAYTHRYDPSRTEQDENGFGQSTHPGIAASKPYSAMYIPRYEAPQTGNVNVSYYPDEDPPRYDPADRPFIFSDSVNSAVHRGHDIHSGTGMAFHQNYNRGQVSWI